MLLEEEEEEEEERVERRGRDSREEEEEEVGRAEREGSESSCFRKKIKNYLNFFKNFALLLLPAPQAT